MLQLLEIDPKALKLRILQTFFDMKSEWDHLEGILSQLLIIRRHVEKEGFLI